MSSLFDLSGKTAFITGAGMGGLGAQSAMALAEAGCKMAVADLPSREEDLHQTMKAIQETGGEAITVPIDVTSEDSVDQAVRTVVDTYGNIDILHNNAGAMLRKPTVDTSLEEWQRIIDVNLTGSWLVARRVGREMLGQNSGKIINVSSLYSNLVGPLPEPAYYASKSGVVNLTRGLASEWGKNNIQVNCIAPGVFYPTNMTQPLADQPGRLESMAERTLLGRLGKPEEIKGVVLFLASQASDYMTGQLLLIDGGWSAW
ncbi:SDR family NAD(P)-dependent oxidoreductase [Virgibacillus sediminis]|uniref:SDR family NAD(P)-dependent oxidoreductase n=1 Tax=Virgibacillus sediminis TaxID=202260 RepID=A0ABV7A9B5_9BACI